MARPSKATGSGSREQWVWGKAVFILAACISMPPVKDSYTSLHLWRRSIAFSPLGAPGQNWNFRSRTGIVFLRRTVAASVPAWYGSFMCREGCHMQMSISYHLCFILRFFKKQLRLTVVCEKDHNWISQKIKSQRIQDHFCKWGGISLVCHSCRVLDVPVVVK